MAFETYKDPIHYKLRSGKVGDEYLAISQSDKVVNGKILLNELPDKFQGLIVKDGTTALSTKDNGNPNTTTVVVDYLQGTLMFDVSFEGKTIVTDYFGRGVISFPVNRVYTITDANGNVTETLKQLTDATTIAKDNAITATGSANTATTNANNATTNANTAADSTKLIWNGVVATYADLPISPVLGDTYQVENDATASNNGTWRWDGSAWVKINSPQVYDNRLGTVEGKLTAQDRTKQTLTYGTSLINGVISSPLDVQIEGKTLVNHGGREGGFHKQGKWDANLTIDTSLFKFGASSGKIDNSAGTAQKLSKNNQKMYLSGKYVLLGVWAKSVSGTPSIQLLAEEWDSTGYLSVVGTSSIAINSTWKFYYIKLDLTTKTGAYWLTRLDVDTYGTTNDVVNFDGLVPYEINKETYDKIGVSLTDQQVADMFPYVDSVQHNQNPIVTVEGENLLPPFYEWTLHANAKVIEPDKLELVATGNFQQSSVKIPAIPSATYTLGVDTGVSPSDIQFYITQLDASGVGISSTSVANSGTDVTFTTASNCVQLHVKAQNGATTSGTYIWSNPMLNLGSTAKPFEPRNPSHLYASVKLGELSGKKDILFKDNGEWKVRKEIEKDFVLDGSLAWAYSADKTGHKIVYTNSVLNPLISSNDNLQKSVKYNGKILLNKGRFVSDITDSDQYMFRDDSGYYVSIADTDSGWLDAWTGTELTTDWIKAWFYGWVYNGDGTTHSWKSVVDGSAPSTNSLAYVSANKAPNFTPYLLSYQLATPQTVVVTDKVEGDLSLSGLAQASVDGGVIVREKANPVLVTSFYRINNSNVTASELKFRTNNIMKIYKNNIDDTLNWKVERNTTNGVGGSRAFISESMFDTSAEYTVDYLLLDKYKFTVNPLSIPVWYSGSLASTVEDLTARNSDNATQISVNTKSIIDILARLKAGGL
jgi:hypothetical protein